MTYDLPSELLLAIFAEVQSDEALLTLAATSRRFNHLSLQVFFAKYNLDPYSKTVVLTPYGASLEKISALSMSLTLQRTSLNHLSFDFGCIDDFGLLLHTIRTLTKYITNLSFVDRVTLYMVVPACPITTEWKAAFVTLLDTVIGKSCSNLHIETDQCSAVGQHHEDLLSIYKSSLISKTTSWLRTRWRWQSELAVIKPSKEAKHLKQCCIPSFPPFLRPFYLRTLQGNASVLTSLSFKNIYSSMGAIDWALLITNIRLPLLKRFAVTSSMIPRHAIIKFLSRHTHITSFEYHHIKYSPGSKRVHCRLKGGLYHLQQLTTTPEHILEFLPPLDQMPFLTSLTIHPEKIAYSPMERIFRRLSSRIKKIELTLYIPCFSLIMGQWLSDPISSLCWAEEGLLLLRCVESLCLQTDDWGYAENEWGYAANILGRLLTLLRLFPELKQLTLHSCKPTSRHSPGVERSTLSPFFERAKFVCPNITSISIQGESEWTHHYTSWYAQHTTLPIVD